MSIPEALQVMNFTREEVNATSLSEVLFVLYFYCSVLKNISLLMIPSQVVLSIYNQRCIVLMKLF